jgi:hypothetical protein
MFWFYTKMIALQSTQSFWLGRDLPRPPAIRRLPVPDFSFLLLQVADAVEATHADWTRRGLTILQPPTAMSFGATFGALHPDGHRLRVFAPAAA